jgi:hypothetical protein
MYVHLATESLEIKRLVGCHVETEYTAVGAAPDGSAGAVSVMNNC